MAVRDRFTGTPGGIGPGQEPDAAVSTADSTGPDADGPPGARPAQVRLEVYGSGEARAASRDADHGTVIKPGPLRPAVPGGFTIDDFTIDEQAGTVTCPAGHAMPMSARTRTVNFGQLCAACPLRTRCTTAKDGRSTRIHPHEDLLRAARAQARTDDFKKAYPTRSAIERIISWTAAQNGCRVRLRYLGAVQEQRLAAHPVRRDQPAHPAPARPDPPRRSLDPGLTATGQHPGAGTCAQPGHPPRPQHAGNAGNASMPPGEHP